MQDATGRRKIYAGFRDAAERRAGAPLLRTLLALAYQQGEAAARDSKPVPPSFVELFGAGTAAGNGFDPFSDGSALRRREAALLRHLGGGTLSSTARLKESVVAGVACVASVPNPATAAVIPVEGDAAPAAKNTNKTGKGG